MKPTVLILVRYFLPGHRGGGPLRSIANIVARLGNEFDFRIVTSDRDVGDSKPYTQVEVDSWNDIDGMRVYYASEKSRTVAGIRSLVRTSNYAALYLNSFFDPLFTLVPTLVHRFAGRPMGQVIVAPRGEFSTGALQSSRLKKRLFLGVASRLRVFRGCLWHASTQHEADDIARDGPGLSPDEVEHDVLIARDLIAQQAASLDAIAPRQRRQGEALRVGFLSRIVPKKNLDLALQVLARVRSNVDFFIYGPTEDARYWQRCRKLASQLPANVSMTYAGEIAHADVPATLARLDLLFLPTRGENFGHVIAEALGAGVPVLTSDQTPWRGLERAGVGWDLPLSQPQAFADAIDAAASWDTAEAGRVSASALAYVAEPGAGADEVAANRRLFAVASRSGHPS